MPSFLFIIVHIHFFRFLLRSDQNGGSLSVILLLYGLQGIGDSVEKMKVQLFVVHRKPLSVCVTNNG